MSDVATWLQIVGAVLLVAGVGLWSVPAAFALAGVVLMVFGVAAEKAG